MATLTPSPKMQFLDANGNPLSGGKLYTYAAGTTTPLATYTDSTGGTPNANPIILDSRGEASVWLGSSLYYMELKTSADVLVWTADNVGGVAILSNLAASSGSSLVGFVQSGTGAVARTAQAKMRERISLSDFCTGTGDESAAIQNAVNAASGKVLEIDIDVSTAGTINGISNIIIRGAGGSITNIDPSAVSDISILTFDSKSNFTVDSVELIGSNKSTLFSGVSGAGICIINCSDFSIINNDIQYNSLNGIKVISQSVGGVDQTVRNGRISGNYFNNNCTAAVNPYTGTVSGSDISMTAGHASGSPADASSLRNIDITENKCLSANGIGIALSGASSNNTGTFSDITITGNQVRDKKQHGILASYGTALGFSIVVANNIIRNCAWMGIYAVGDHADFVVSNNRLINTCSEIGSNAANAVTLTTGTSWSGGSITYKTVEPHYMTVGLQVIVTGASPAGYNSTPASPHTVATIVDDFTFTVVHADPGAWVSGGSVAKVPSLAWAAISLNGSTAFRNAVVSGNSITNINGHSGIRIVSGTYCGADGNNVSGNIVTPQAQYAWYDNGITFEDCTYSKISGNTIRFTGYEGNGIYLDTQSGGGGGVAANQKAGNSVIGNTIYNPSLRGIHARMQKNALYSGNTIISAVNEGIICGDSSRTLISGNVIGEIAAGYAGIRVNITSGTGDFTDSIVVEGNKLASTSNALGIWIEAATTRYATVRNNDISNVAVAAFGQKIVNTGLSTTVDSNRYGTDSLKGSVTLGAAASTTVNNNNLHGLARVILTPTNAAAGTLVSGANSPYVPPGFYVVGTSFDIKTAGGGAAAGTETFEYQIF